MYGGKLSDPPTSSISHTDLLPVLRMSAGEGWCPSCTPTAAVVRCTTPYDLLLRDLFLWST